MEEKWRGTESVAIEVQHEVSAVMNCEAMLFAGVCGC